jgi:hypothetical protein
MTHDEGYLDVPGGRVSIEGLAGLLAALTAALLAGGYATVRRLTV